MKVNKLLFLTVFFPIWCLAETSAVRHLPATYIPGRTVTISIDVVVEETSVYGVIVKEQIPADWTMVETMVNPSYSAFDPVERIYKWLKFSQSGVSSFTISYALNVPLTASGNYQFSGQILTNINPYGSEISGDNTLLVGRGDIDGNSAVDISDVILCLRMAIKLDEPDIEKADIDNDGIVDISDVILILRISIGLL